MKICILGVPAIKPGRHNLKDPRLDQTHELVEADKKTHAQVEVVEEEHALDADAIIVTAETRADLILKDLEIVETRLGRAPEESEKQALTRIQAALENEQFIHDVGLSPEELAAVSAHRFHTRDPVVVATPGDLEAPETLILKAFQAAGCICFLTVGGKENRAWPINKGATAWEAAGSIHSDLQRGFIRAEVIGFDDFLQAGGEKEAKRAGKQRLETKEYVVQDYDLMNFRFSK